ncbi:MAG TPA: DUF1501 domain-containing protein [Stellaceae bacterium]
MRHSGFSRRDLLAAPLVAGLLRFGAQAWAAPADGGPRRLIVIMLRGAVDGLSVVVPYGEDAYYDARPTIAIPRPGTAGSVLPLDSRFGLHPALAGLMPLWAEKGLAFVHAAGSPDPTRSHFDAQRYIETGTPGRDTTPDGWMNRLLQALPGERGSTDALAIGPTLPRILAGKAPVANLALGSSAAKALPIDRPELGAAFDRLYAGTAAVDRAWREGRSARARLIAGLAAEQRAADNGAPPPTGFPAQAARLARLIARDTSIRLAFVALGGWDSHVDQGSTAGPVARRLRLLGDGLAVLARGLGAAWRDTAIVVVSEFGRTVRENGDGGTDHGHGNVIWFAGGVINGGRVYGDWPGLAPDRLYQRRDLAVTTDFRAAIGLVVARHLRLSDSQLAAIFPSAPAAGADLAAMVRG